MSFGIPIIGTPGATMPQAQMAQVAAKRMILLIAMTCYEVNRGYCRALDENDPTVPWAEASKETIESTVAGVEAHLQETGLTPEQSHGLWLQDKIDDGWKYGKKKDVEKKTHPCLVPYDQLPKDQRVKDHLFAATVRQCLVFANALKNTNPRVQS